MKTVAIACATLFAVLAVCGSVYEQIGRNRDRARFPQIGHSVSLGARSLNLFCSGEGSPAVIFETDALEPGYSWTEVQRQVAVFTRACWYDRAGYGWSDPGPAPRTSLASARDLHALLQNAGISPPYLLAAAGFGAFNARVFASQHRGEVVGMILADPAHEDELTRFPEERGGAARVPFHLGYPPELVIRLAGFTGMMRLATGSNGRQLPMLGLSAPEQALLTGLRNQPKMRAAFLAERAFASGPDEVRAAGKLGDLPLIVLASDTPVENTRQIARHEARMELRQETAHLSARGRLIEVKDDEGCVPCEKPAALVQAIREIRQAIP